MNIPLKIKSMMNKLLNARYETRIIGGAVRDYIMGLEPNDYDIFTNATGEQILELFPKGTVIGNEERQDKILTVVVGGVEISQYRANGERTQTGNNLKDHLSTCDFTMNAIAMDINGKTTDLHNGIEDIKNKVIRAVGEPERRIKEDKLRVMRAVRFKIKYNLKIEQELDRWLKITKLNEIPQERVREELLKMVIYPDALDILDHYGFLDEVFLDWKEIRDMEGGDYHNEHIDTHNKNSFRNATSLTNNPLLCIAAGLHDIGKGRTSEIIDGKLTFHNHENVGVEMIEEALDRLKFPKKWIHYITFLVKNHMFGYMEDIKNKSYARFFAKCENAEVPVEDYILLIYCDHQANLSKQRIKFGDFLKDNPIYVKYLELLGKKVPFGIKDLDISGKEIIDMGIKQGKEIGFILNRVLDEVQEGRLKNHKGILLEWTRTFVRDNCWTK